jgi:hypothetical protein
MFTDFFQYEKDKAPLFDSTAKIKDSNPKIKDTIEPIQLNKIKNVNK